MAFPIEQWVFLNVPLRSTCSLFMKPIYIFLFALIASSSVLGQSSRYTVSGYIKDASTGEELIGATVVVKERSGLGAASNAYGFYSLTLPAGEHILSAQFIGYTPIEERIVLDRNLKLNFELTEQGLQIDEVVITGERADQNVKSVQMGVERMDIKEINAVPVLFGEKDLIKTIQLMPGVKVAGEGSTGFFVRGGAADQNLILLDEATVYNASHLLGFFSVFNSDALKDVTLFKGTQPAQFGGRLSSVLDIKMKDGNNKRFGAEGGVGLISSRLTLEGPIVKDRSSFIVSGRRTYADMFLKLSNDPALNESRLYFYDLNMKANYRINDKHRVFLSGYFGRDALGFQDLFGIYWGNATGTIRWNWLISDKLFSNTSLIYSNYDYRINLNALGTSVDIFSRIRDFNLKQDFQYYASSKSKINFGFNAIHHNIVPGAIRLSSDVISNLFELPTQNSVENAVYASHEYTVSPVLSIEYGLRLSAFTPLGPGEFYSYDDRGDVVDTARFDRREPVLTYLNLEPRLAINYLLTEKSSIKAGYARNTQNMHLLTNTTSGNPTDLWIPSSNNVRPQIADQVSIGYFRNFRNNTWEFSTETYYKALQNQIDYKDGAELNFNETVESQLLFGEGRAYGVEFYLKKKTGRLNGWVSYTLSRIENRIDGINNGEFYAANQDRTHDFSIVALYAINQKVQLSASWVYFTGNAVTFPSGKYELEGQILNFYTERNAYRMPDFHRLDLGVTIERKKTERFESSWNFSLYNAYGRQNAFVINFEPDPEDPTRTRAVQTALFRWIPSATYNFKF